MSKRGFNLIEAAIVLGVVGLVLGGIWVAASAVQSNVRKSDGSKGLLQIVQNVRNLYANQSPAPATITTQLINARAIPADFINGSNALNPWNGAVTVALAGPGPANSIQVVYAAMPRDVCIEVTTRNTREASATGLTQILINNGTTTATITTFPYLPATAATDCGVTNTITWAYNLR
jgi:hypothetical protein